MSLSSDSRGRLTAELIFLKATKKYQVAKFVAFLCKQISPIWQQNIRGGCTTDLWNLQTADQIHLSYRRKYKAKRNFQTTKPAYFSHLCSASVCCCFLAELTATTVSTVSSLPLLSNGRNMYLFWSYNCISPFSRFWISPDWPVDASLFLFLSKVSQPFFRVSFRLRLHWNCCHTAHLRFGK